MRISRRVRRAMWGVACLVSMESGLRADSPLPPSETDTVYVSSYGTDEIVRYERDGSFRSRFKHADLDGPRGLAFSPSGELYASAQLTDRVLVFSAAGGYLRQFTASGLDGPTSVAFGTAGRLFVSSFSTDEVFVFENDEPVDTFTAPGLNGPNCIAFRGDGSIYVVSQLDSRVYLFQEDFTFEKSFTGGGLLSAMGAAIYGDELFVTGGSSHTVAVFDLDGGFLRNITHEIVNAPQGIAFDDEGNFSVASFSTGAVGKFQRDGTLVDVYEEVGVRVARSVAFLPLTADPMFIRGDANRDRTFDIADPVAVLFYLFLGAGSDRCLDAADADDDGVVDPADVTYALSALFASGEAPPIPYPEAGLDPTADDLGCR